MSRLVILLLACVMLPSAAHAVAFKWTFYGPGAAGNMQGGLTAARNNPDGNNTIRTLDDVRTGASRYITLASANTMSGRWFCLGTVTYTSPQTRQTHTLENVVGYVHDTGCAFNGSCSCGWLPQFCNGQSRPDKMDIPIGNFNGWGAGPTMEFITRNTNRAAADWQQISGLPQPGATGIACGGEPRETAMPVVATYSPTNLGDVAPGPLAGGAFANNPYAMQQFMQQGNSPYGISQQQLAQIASPMSNQYQQQVTPIPTSPTQPGQQGPAGPGGSAAQLLVQPGTPRAGQPVLVSWTSVGMKSAPFCDITIDGDLDGGPFGSGKEGTKMWVATPGSHVFALICGRPDGTFLETTKTISVQ